MGQVKEEGRKQKKKTGEREKEEPFFQAGTWGQREFTEGPRKRNNQRKSTVKKVSPVSWSERIAV